MGQTVQAGERVAVRTHNGHSRNRRAYNGYEFGTVDYVVAANAEVLFDDGTRCRLGVTELITGAAHDVLAILAVGGPAPVPHPMQWLADLGFRHLVIVSTLETRTAISFFDVLGKVGEADEEMERLGETGKFTDSFGIALAIEARK